MQVYHMVHKTQWQVHTTTAKQLQNNKHVQNSELPRSCLENMSHVKSRAVGGISYVDTCLQVDFADAELDAEAWYCLYSLVKG